MALGSLKVELLSAILEYVDHESPNTTKSVSLVNKHLYASARRVRSRRQLLDLAEPRKTRSHVSQLLAEADTLRSIRHLTIVGHIYSGFHERPEVQSVCESLASLIQSVANLRSLAWRCTNPIPLGILDAIHQYQPKAALKIYNWSREAEDTDQNDPAELALTHSPALTYLQARIWNAGGGSQLDLREIACKRIIANAPNLQYASVATGIAGCVFRILSAADHEELAKKKELFYTHKQPSTSLKALTIDGYVLSRETLDQWGMFVDLSKLESLECSREGWPEKSCFELAPKLLTSLKHVSLGFGDGIDPEMAATVDNYLATCPPLETISLWNWMKMVSLPSILKHGPTMKTLQLHERESANIDIPRRLLTATDVAGIRRACPILHEFTMDIDREAQEWDEEMDNRAIYRELALFGSQLDKIQLYFNLGIAARIANAISPRPSGRAPSALEDPGSSSDSESDNDREGPQAKVAQNAHVLSAREKAMLPLLSPRATSEHVRSIWTTIFGQRRTGERALDIKIGEWERDMGIGFPSGWMMWEQNMRSYIKLRPHERDDMLDEVVLTCQGGLQGQI